jgi:hypothetical protein
MFLQQEQAQYSRSLQWNFISNRAILLATTSTITKTFTANSATNTLVVSYLNTVATNVTVSNISVVPSGTNALRSYTTFR